MYVFECESLIPHAPRSPSLSKWLMELVYLAFLIITRTNRETAGSPRSSSKCGGRASEDRGGEKMRGKKLEGKQCNEIRESGCEKRLFFL